MKKSLTLTLCLLLALMSSTYARESEAFDVLTVPACAWAAQQLTPADQWQALVKGSPQIAVAANGWETAGNNMSKMLEEMIANPDQWTLLDSQNQSLCMAYYVSTKDPNWNNENFPGKDKINAAIVGRLKPAINNAVSDDTQNDTPKDVDTLVESLTSSSATGTSGGGGTAGGGSAGGSTGSSTGGLPVNSPTPPANPGATPAESPLSPMVGTPQSPMFQSSEGGSPPPLVPGAVELPGSNPVTWSPSSISNPDAPLPPPPAAPVG